MLSACFATASDRRHLSYSSGKNPIMNPKTALTTAFKIFGAGILCLIVLLCADPAFAADVALAWDSNNEADLEGYGVYLKKGTPGPPYNLFGYVTTGELSNPSNPLFTVTGLEQGARYYFAVTAYDTDGNESYFSNSVCAEVGGVIAPCSDDSGGGGGGDSGGGSRSSGGGGGSGGGAGCFIETASADTPRFNPGPVALLGLGCMVAGAILMVKRP
jgi:uncharacterized membrane protein YgcG